VSDNNKSEDPETPESNDVADDPGPDSRDQEPYKNGPTFTKGPDPLAGVKKTATDAMESMEGKTVSMKTYVGSIAAVIILMLLARCGG